MYDKFRDFLHHSWEGRDRGTGRELVDESVLGLDGRCSTHNVAHMLLIVHPAVVSRGRILCVNAFLESGEYQKGSEKKVWGNSSSPFSSSIKASQCSSLCVHAPDAC